VDDDFIKFRCITLHYRFLLILGLSLLPDMI
jgi:hypothetical protein